MLIVFVASSQFAGCLPWVSSDIVVQPIYGKVFGDGLPLAGVEIGTENGFRPKDAAADRYPPVLYRWQSELVCSDLNGAFCVAALRHWSYTLALVPVMPSWLPDSRLPRIIVNTGHERFGIFIFDYENEVRIFRNGDIDKFIKYCDAMLNDALYSPDDYAITEPYTVIEFCELKARNPVIIQLDVHISVLIDKDFFNYYCGDYPARNHPFSLYPLRGFSGIMRPSLDDNELKSLINGTYSSHSTNEVSPGTQSVSNNTASMP